MSLRRKRKQRPLPPPSIWDLERLAKQKAQAEYEMTFFDEWPEEIRKEMTRFSAFCHQVEQLMALGIPWSTILRELEREERGRGK